MRHVITRNEHDWYIRNRWEFGTRRLYEGRYVYQGYYDISGDYVVRHWDTTIAIFHKDGSVYLDYDHTSVTTSRLRNDIWRAMTPAERESAAHGIIVRMRNDAIRYPWWSHNNPRFRAMLARWESIYYTPERMRAA